MLIEQFGKQLLFFDGAMGTQLQEAGLKPGDIPDLWNATNANAVRDIHKKYLAAGCDIIITNTFGCNALKLAGTGFTVNEIASLAVANAKAAADEFTASKQRYVALDIGPTGRLLKPFGALGFEEAYTLFSETIAAGANAGADLIIIETMSDTYEIKAAVLAAKENCGLPVIASVTLANTGKMLMGGGTDVAVTLLEGLGVDVIGFNCGLGPEQLTPFISQALDLSSTPILFMPNAGLPTYDGGATQYNVGPEAFALAMHQNAENGVWLLGGCCGTTPAHIEALVKNCAGVVPPAVTHKGLNMAASYNKTVVFGSKPVISGERIKAAENPKLKQALLDGDYDIVLDIVLDECLSQIEEGSEVININMGMPGVNEKKMLKALVEHLQGYTNAPLQIETTDIEAMAEAMRVYNGKPIIKSANTKVMEWGSAECMDAILPLVKRYGGVVVAPTDG
jgi:5-methyltetrahydrofolate--homocysteine methyltransferase